MQIISSWRVSDSPARPTCDMIRGGHMTGVVIFKADEHQDPGQHVDRSCRKHLHLWRPHPDWTLASVLPATLHTAAWMLRGTIGCLDTLQFVPQQFIFLSNKKKQTNRQSRDGDQGHKWKIKFQATINVYVDVGTQVEGVGSLDEKLDFLFFSFFFFSFLNP